MNSSLPGLLRAYFKPCTFRFIKPGGTSRGILTERKSWFLAIHQSGRPEIKGIGECAPLKGLSIDDRPDFPEMLQEVCDNISDIPYWMSEGLNDFPSIKFGLESALLDFYNSGKRILYPSAFTGGSDSIQINGLIWMGDFKNMKQQAENKIAEGFRCIKMKIGAIEFDKELDLLKFIRDKYSENEIELRVDANGAFPPNEAMEKLEQLSKFKLHSIEQPIRQGQWNEMAEICRKSPVPIALDEELIGIKTKPERRRLLYELKPQYIILKPSLAGGFSASLEWINLAKEQNTGWWITSALESNIGLNAIAQWTYTLGNPMPQGLGTGQLYENNADSPLCLQGDRLFFKQETGWRLPQELS